MYLFLHLWLIFFSCNLLSFDGKLMPEEYDRKLIFGDNKLGLNLMGNISYFYFSSPSLLVKSCNIIQYVQQVYDLVLGYSVEDYLLAKVDLRSRILWGSNQDLIDSNGLSFVGFEYGDHSHELENKNFFWLREGWVNLDLSRFMGLAKSVNLTIGTIPYMVGRGISYGIVYSELPGFIGADSGAVIEEFAPAVLLSMELYSNKNHTLFGDLYCAILNNWSGSLEENIEPIYEKRIWHCPDKPERGFGHINTAMVAQLKYEAISKYGLLQVQPYVLCNLNPESQVRLTSNLFVDGLAAYSRGNNSESLKILNSKTSSKLITLGCMINWSSEKFCFNFEWAINKGGLKIYGRDGNSSLIIPPSANLYNEPFINIVNDEVFDFTYDDQGNFALINDTNQPIIENSPKGPEYNGQVISTQPDLENLYTRFVNPKKIDYQGAMAVADFAYWLKPEKLVLAFTAGFATGGSFQILNYIYDYGQLGPVPNIDDSGSYSGFISLQELYTGLWVQSAFGMGGPFLRKAVANPTDFYSGSSGLFFKELFNDIKFLGLSMNFFPTLKSSLSFNTNYYWSFCDPVEVLIPDSIISRFYSLETNNKFLSKNLGLEIFLLGKYELLENLEAFLSWAIFFPGSRYFETLLPLDFFDWYLFSNYVGDLTITSFYKTDSTKFNPVYLFNAGFEYSF
jgi:hypothetical protein